MLCSGKVYVDADSADRRAAAADVALCRVEQLYPFPAEAVQQLDRRLSGSARMSSGCRKSRRTWARGNSLRPLLEDVIGGRCPLRYIGRARSSSPSEGSAAWHQINQNMLVEQVFDRARQAEEPSMVLSKQA